MTALATATAGTAAGLSLIDRINSFLLPFFGVPFTVVTMAAAGAGVSFIHGDRETDTMKMFKQIIGNTFLSLLIVVVIPKMFSMQWVEPGITPAIAALVAWGSRWALPATIRMMPDIVKRTFKLREYKNVGDDWSDDSDGLKKRYYDEDNEE